TFRIELKATWPRPNRDRGSRPAHDAVLIFCALGLQAPACPQRLPRNPGGPWVGWSRWTVFPTGCDRWSTFGPDAAFDPIPMWTAIARAQCSRAGPRDA